MAKGQKNSGREAKKPKGAKKPIATVADARNATAARIVAPKTGK